MPTGNDTKLPLVKRSEQALAELFKDVNRGGSPGMSVGATHRGRSIYRKGFGLASIERGVTNTPTTLMRIGSTTKHFTCLAALLLAEEGKLDIDAPVRRYMPELPALQSEPTLRQLMTHTGGIRDYLDLAFIGNGSAAQPLGASLAAQVRQSQANFRPTEKMIYCNGGYQLLSICIDRASGMSFEEFLSERIFKPMGMVDTVAAPHDMEIRRGMATLHIPTAAGDYRRGILPSEEVRGEGSIISTVDDMLRWAAHLRAPNKLIGSPESWRQMFTATHLADGTPTHYGLGLMLHDYRGVQEIHHPGSVMGGMSQMLTVPEHDSTSSS
jgi:D-aminopeptidase